MYAYWKTTFRLFFLVPILQYTNYELIFTLMYVFINLSEFWSSGNKTKIEAMQNLGIFSMTFHTLGLQFGLINVFLFITRMVFILQRYNLK